MATDEGYKWDLKDIDPREVSLVDIPANKKRFAIVKRDGGKAMGGTNEEGTGIEKQDIPAPVLAAVLKKTQSAIERLISLASNLEGMQKKGEQAGEEGVEKADKAPLPKAVAGEYRAIIQILEGILSSYPSAAQKGEATAGDDKLAKDEEKVMKKFEEMAKELKDISAAVAEMRKKDEPKGGAEEKKEEGAVEKEELKKTLDVAKEEIAKEIKEELTKALDDRAKELVKLFQEAAKEEFGGVFKRVETIEKALGGAETGNKEKKGGDEKPYERNYGHEEVDADVTNEENPFFSIFNTVKDF